MQHVDRIFINGAPAWQWLGKYVTMDERFYNILFKKLVAAAPVTFTFSSLSHSSRRPLLEINIIIILCINYIICINDDDAVINSMYGRFQHLIVLFKIPMGTQKDFFKIYRQFGHMPSKRFTSPVLAQRQVVQSWR